MTVPLSAFGLPSPVPLWEALFLTVLSYGVGVLGGIVGLALGTMRLPFLLLLGGSLIVLCSFVVAVRRRLGVN